MFMPKRCKTAIAVKNNKNYNKIIPKHEMGHAKQKFKEDSENSKVIIEKLE